MKKGAQTLHSGLISTISKLARIECQKNRFDSSQWSKKRYNEIARNECQNLIKLFHSYTISRRTHYRRTDWCHLQQLFAFWTHIVVGCPSIVDLWRESDHYWIVQILCRHSQQHPQSSHIWQPPANQKKVIKPGSYPD